MSEVAEAPRPSRLVAPGAIGWLRLAVAMAGAIAAGVALYLMDPDSALVWTEVGLLGVATLLMPLDRVDVHVFVRAALWGVLAVGGIATLLQGQAPQTTALCGSAISLLALGRAGLDGTWGAFAPRVLRRSLLTMMVVGLCVAHVFAVSAVILETTRSPWVTEALMGDPAAFFAHAGMLLNGPLLLVGVLGLSRTRSWGLFAYLGSVLCAGVVLTLLLTNGYPGFGEIPGWIFMAFVWGVGDVLLVLVALPVAAAVVFKQTPSPEGKPWGQYVHAALIFAAVAGAFAIRAQLF